MPLALLSIVLPLACEPEMELLICLLIEYLKLKFIFMHRVIIVQQIPQHRQDCEVYVLCAI
uniref:Uncharacterized protein n=1 Tax=Arundo donax TaxID=35708 RepID=A0A0A9BCM9_ARUDO